MVALITRTGGGIFEAATEAGSELVGKAEGALPFTHSRNAATVALHAGHYVEAIIGA
jgi:Na+/H+-translocating membrane pyrophosphatase